MDDKQVLTFAGDVEIVSIVVTTVQDQKIDISNIVTQIDIYEDIFSPSISANITVSDTYDLLGTLPLLGEEYVDITFKTPGVEDSEFVIPMFLYKITDIVQMGSNNYMYSLALVTVEAMTDMLSKVSKSFSGTPSEIVEKILKEDIGTEKKLFIEKTKNIQKHVSPFWTPFANIGFLAGRSVHQVNNSADFMFFETLEGYHYKPLSVMYQPQDSEVFKYKYDMFQRDATDRGSNKDPERSLKKVEKYRITRYPSFMERLQNGAFGATYMSYDLYTKRYVSRGITYDKQFEQQVHLNKFPFNTAIAPYNNDATMVTVARHQKNYPQNSPDYVDSYLLERLMQVGGLESFKLIITVPGRFDAHVGQVIDFDFFKNRPKDFAVQSDEDLLNPIMSGRYLITAVHHTINRERHEMDLEISKDSYSIEPTYNIPDGTETEQ